VTELEAAEARVVESARSVISVINGSVTGHARHAADLASRASNPANTIDPIQEFTIFSNRAIRDGAALFRSIWAVLEALAEERIAAWRERIPPPSDIAFTTQRETVLGACRIFLRDEAERAPELLEATLQQRLAASLGERSPAAQPAASRRRPAAHLPRAFQQGPLGAR